MIPPFSRRAALLAAAALGGCSVLPQRPYQERREWPLDVRRPVALPPAPGGRVLLVRGLRAGPGMDARGLRLRQSDGAEHLDYWEEWAVPPPQAIESCLRQWLADSGLFAAVVMPGSDLPPDLILEGELLALAGDAANMQARAALSLVLLRPGPGRASPLLQRSLTGESRMSGTGGAELAAALRSAVVALLREVESSLRALV